MGYGKVIRLDNERVTWWTTRSTNYVVLHFYTYLRTAFGEHAVHHQTILGQIR